MDIKIETYYEKNRVKLLEESRIRYYKKREHILTYSKIYFKQYYQQHKLELIRKTSKRQHELMLLKPKKQNAREKLVTEKNIKLKEIKTKKKLGKIDDVEFTEDGNVLMRFD
jgi:hypothetical protein